MKLHIEWVEYRKNGNTKCYLATFPFDENTILNILQQIN